MVRRRRMCAIVMKGHRLTEFDASLAIKFCLSALHTFQEGKRVTVLCPLKRPVFLILPPPPLLPSVNAFSPRRKGVGAPPPLQGKKRNAGKGREEGGSAPHPSFGDCTVAGPSSHSPFSSLLPSEPLSLSLLSSIPPLAASPCLSLSRSGRSDAQTAAEYNKPCLRRPSAVSPPSPPRQDVVL